MTSLITYMVVTVIALGPPAITSTNDSLNVTTRGTGQPVIFVPGLIGSEYGYRALIARLDTTKYQTIVIEPLGFGSSDRPADADYSFTAQADRIATIVDDLVEGPAWFVAHSVGASIVFRLAYRHPEIVRGVVSLEGGITESLATPGFRTAMKFVPVFRMMGPRAIMGIMRQQMASASANDAWISEETILGYGAGYRRDFDASLNALRAMSRAEEPESLRDNLGSIRCPVVLVLGASEHKSGPSQDAVEIMGHAIPNFSVTTIAGAGHFVHEENPDAVAVALQDFMSVSGSILSAREPQGRSD